MAERARNDLIDAYRAILIGAVLCFHFLVRWAPPEHTENLYGYDNTYSHLWQIGAYGVQVFFVISGLVITMTLLRSHDALDFVFRRFSRLYPAAIVCTTATFIVTRLAGPPVFQSSLVDLFASYTLLAPTFHAKFVDGAYWSLVVELKFYVLIALSYFAVREKFWLLVTGFALLQFAGEMLGFHKSFLGNGLIGEQIPFFLFGMALWYALFEADRIAATTLGIASLITIPAALPALTLDGATSAIAAAAVIGTIASMVALLMMKVRVPPGLPYLGRISYSLYLLHQVIGTTLIVQLKKLTQCPDLVAFALATCAVVALAMASFHFVEVPAQKWLRAHYLKRRPQLETEKSPLSAS